MPLDKWCALRKGMPEMGAASGTHDGDDRRRSPDALWTSHFLLHLENVLSSVFTFVQFALLRYGARSSRFVRIAGTCKASFTPAPNGYRAFSRKRDLLLPVPKTKETSDRSGSRR